MSEYTVCAIIVGTVFLMWITSGIEFDGIEQDKMKDMFDDYMKQKRK